MNKACVFFKVSDIVMHYPRNYRKYPDVRVVKDFVYDEKYPKYCRADMLFLPDRESYPVIVNVHGGGFVKGDKRHRRAICSELARLGYFVYNVNYRLAPQYAMPSANIDVVNALNSLKKLEKEYKLDLSTVILTGDSAGGFYSASGALACVSDEYAALLGAGKPEVKPTAFMGFCGAYRLDDILAQKTPFNVADDIAAALMGVKCGQKIELDKLEGAKFTDLVKYVDGGFPTSYLVYSKHDDFCGGQGELLKERLEKSGVRVEEFVATDEKDIHCFHLLPKHKTYAACMEATRSFLKTFGSAPLG